MKQLLLMLCRFPFDKSNRETLSTLIEEVQDWQKMAKLINEHGIIALAYYHIKEAGLEDKVPADAMTSLENGYRQSIIRNLWLTQNWKEVNEILAAAGIKHVLLKGMALEHTVYGARGLRQMNDNDILINKINSHKAWDLLIKNGFSPDPLKSPLFNKILFKFGRHLPALYKNGYAIEIHEKLFDDAYTVNEDRDPFSDIAEITIDDTKAYILQIGIHLKYLKQHFEHHKLVGDCQLRMYNDILILEPQTKTGFPDTFITDPMQGSKQEFRVAAYKKKDFLNTSATQNEVYHW